MATRRRKPKAKPLGDPNRQCKDCTSEGITTKRPAPHPGPRCVTHHRAARKAQRARAASLRVEKVYGLTSAQYEALRAAQGFVCAICLRPSRVRRLAVDHDHVTGEVRGLLCRRCNYDLLGFYSSDSLLRAARYLLVPPAFDVIGTVIVPTDDRQAQLWTEIDDE